MVKGLLKHLHKKCVMTQFKSTVHGSHLLASLYYPLTYSIYFFKFLFFKNWKKPYQTGYLVLLHPHNMTEAKWHQPIRAKSAQKIRSSWPSHNVNVYNVHVSSLNCTFLSTQAKKWKTCPGLTSDTDSATDSLSYNRTWATKCIPQKRLTHIGYLRQSPITVYLHQQERPN